MNHKRKLIFTLYAMLLAVLCLSFAILYLKIFDWLVYGAACMFVILGQSVIEYHTKDEQMTWFASVRDVLVVLSGITIASFVVSIPNLFQETATYLIKLLFLVMGTVGLWGWIFLLGSDHVKKLIPFWKRYSPL